MHTSIRRRIIGILISILLTIFAIDFCLYHLDPLGVVAAVHGSQDFHAVMIDERTGYAIRPGVHQFHDWTATILGDGSRLVPDTNPQAECTIAAIGDSMTFGSGVNDGETWINLLATQLQDVHFINTARGDYSAPNVAALKEAYAANGYIWLLIYNDSLEAYRYRAIYPAHPYPPAIALYRAWFVNRVRGIETQSERAVNMETYWQSVEAINDRDTLIVGFAGDELTMQTAERYPLILIPPYTDFVSVVDRHPTAIGHQQIAAALSSVVLDFIEAVCP